MQIGDKIKEIRLSLNKSLRDFDTLTGISYGYLGLLERGNSGHANGKKPSPTIEVLQQICDRSGYDFRTFLEETGYLTTSLQKQENPQPIQIEAPTSPIQKLFDAMDKNMQNQLIGFAKGLLADTEIDIDELLA